MRKAREAHRPACHVEHCFRLGSASYHVHVHDGFRPLGEFRLGIEERERPFDFRRKDESDRPGRPLQFPLANQLDRKSTRLNSSHGYISYAVFCLKKKKDSRRYYAVEKCNNTHTAVVA